MVIVVDVVVDVVIGVDVVVVATVIVVEEGSVVEVVSAETSVHAVKMTASAGTTRIVRFFNIASPPM